MRRLLDALLAVPALSLALALALALAGPPGPARAAAAPPAPVTLRIASGSDPATMDPHSLALLYHTRVVFRIYEGLVGRDEQYRLAPALALDWQRVDPFTWRFRLRPGVRFHDGRPFTADDVVFSIERALAAPSRRAFTLGGVTGARRVDALTVDLRLSTPDPVLPEKLPLVAMRSRGWCEEHRATRAQDYDARQETFAVRHANGTGPYRLERYEPDARAVLQAHPGWWGRGRTDRPAGNVDQVAFITIRADATRLAALAAGEVDLVIDPPFQDVDRLQRDPRLRLTRITDANTNFLAFDQHSAGPPGAAPSADAGRNPFRDVRVRRAVYHAVNVDLIIQKVLRGQGVAAGSVFAPIMEGHAPEFEQRLRHDPVRARALLAEAGWPRGFSTPMECVNVPWRMSVCQAVAAMLAQVGIRVDLHASPGAQFYPQVTQGTAPFLEYGWTTTADAWANLNGLLRSWTPSGGGTFNAGRYANARLDVLIDDIRTEGDPARRRALVAGALRIAGEDLPYVPLFRRVINWAMRQEVERVVMWPDDTVPVEWVRMR